METVANEIFAKHGWLSLKRLSVSQSSLCLVSFFFKFKKQHETATVLRIDYVQNSYRDKNKLLFSKNKMCSWIDQLEVQNQQLPSSLQMKIM
jgi:hypothetical protein